VPDHHSPQGGLLDVDWRFLLPRPPAGRFRRLILLGAPEGVASRVEQVGLAEEVALSPGGRADAVVRLAGARATLRECAALVDRGGALLYEARRSPAARAAAAPGRLVRELGLTPRGLWWVHPGFNGARTYFPLHAEHAIRWYAESIHRAADLRTELAMRALTLARALEPGRLGRLAPRIALVAVSSAEPESHGLPVPGELLPPALRGQELHPLVLVHGDEQSRVVMLPFGRSSHRPLAVVKLERSPPGAAGDEEQAVLAAVRGRLGAPLRATVPEPLGAIRADGVAASVETFLPGERLHSRWTRRRAPLALLLEDLELASRWLREFGLQARSELITWAAGDAETWVEGPLRSYEQAFGRTPSQSRLFGAARRRAREMAGAELPIVWQHGDFSSLNLFRYGRQVHVIDWEAAAPGLPLDDLLYFTTRWLYHVRDATIEESPRGRRAAAIAFRELFLEPERRDAAVDAARAAIRAHVDALGIDERFLPLLTLLPWVSRAVGRLGRQATPGWSRAPAPPRDEPRAGNRYVAQVDILAGDVERLFHPAGPAG
jgi:hypothetical protein